MNEFLLGQGFGCGVVETPLMDEFVGGHDVFIWVPCVHAYCEEVLFRGFLLYWFLPVSHSLEVGKVLISVGCGQQWRVRAVSHTPPVVGSVHSLGV